jgi:hypothetical protein
MIGGKVTWMCEIYAKLHFLTGDRPFTSGGLIGLRVNAV